MNEVVPSPYAEEMESYTVDTFEGSVRGKDWARAAIQLFAGISSSRSLRAQSCCRRCYDGEHIDDRV